MKNKLIKKIAFLYIYSVTCLNMAKLMSHMALHVFWNNRFFTKTYCFNSKRWGISLQMCGREFWHYRCWNRFFGINPSEWRILLGFNPTKKVYKNKDTSAKASVWRHLFRLSERSEESVWGEYFSLVQDPTCGLHFQTSSLSFRRKSPTYEFARFTRLHSAENPPEWRAGEVR